MVHEFPVSSRDVTNQTPPGQELFSYDVIIPAQGQFGSDIPAGDGKLANLFLRCKYTGVLYLYFSTTVQKTLIGDFFCSKVVSVD
jgi:hypothetical protein